MRLETINEIRNLLLSERITYKGNELPLLSKIIADLDAEAAEQVRAARVRPVLTDTEKTAA